MEHNKELQWEITKIIRETSRTECLVRREEILEQLVGQGVLGSDPSVNETQFGVALQQVLAKNPDIDQVSGESGVPHYYSSLTLSAPYACILVRKGEHSLLAEVVRNNSATYPRPVPLDMFREPPFDLDTEELENRLKEMGDEEEYRDIAQTATSSGRVFLYSSDHLDPSYAAVLAEWIDVGGANNP